MDLLSLPVCLSKYIAGARVEFRRWLVSAKAVVTKSGVMAMQGCRASRSVCTLGIASPNCLTTQTTGGQGYYIS